MYFTSAGTVESCCTGLPCTICTGHSPCRYTVSAGAIFALTNAYPIARPTVPVLRGIRRAFPIAKAAPRGRVVFAAAVTVVEVVAVVHHACRPGDQITHHTRKDIIKYHGVDLASPHPTQQLLVVATVLFTPFDCVRDEENNLFYLYNWKFVSGT